VLLAFRGFPYFGAGQVANASLWELPVAAFHLPAIALLSATGHCCGLNSGLVLGPRVVAGHIRMTGEGLLLLAVVNWMAWSLVLAAGWGGWRLRPRKAGRGAALAEGPPPTSPEA
jgi:hypothetical protein